VVEAYDKKFTGRVVDIAQRMGRKNQRTDDPTERIDTKIREVVMELDDARELVPGLRATGYLSETKLESKSKVAQDQQGKLSSKGQGESPVMPTAPAGGGGLKSSSSATMGARPETPEEWDRRGAALLKDGKDREAVMLYREAVTAFPALRTRVAELVGQYKASNLELAYCLDPSDKTLAAAWAKGGAERRSLCAESK
jgi:hypothetical protein